ncbi:MAG: site-specific DNA-methyltransferase [Colwellia sp.]|nr:site-specific DNA-methyltransferase [Colwellia sp.]
MDHDEQNKPWLMMGDCLERMKEIPDGSVDMILTDPPYGTMKGMLYEEMIKCDSNHDWDNVIEQQKMLEECNRILRPRGGLILFSQDPYTAKLMTETHDNLPFSYRLTWLKDNYGHALLAKKAPLNYTEDVCVFFKKYDALAQHPLRDYAEKIFCFIGKNKKQIFSEMGHQGVCHFMRIDSTQFGLCTKKTYQELINLYKIDNKEWFVEFEKLEEINRKFSRKFNLQGKKFKSNVLSYKKDYTGFHPTQKPVLLLEDLIKTYTNENDTVLDFTMGSGSTGVATKNLNRKFIGIELDEGYFNIAKERINKN